jgi:hypothetical protein
LCISISVKGFEIVLERCIGKKKWDKFQDSRNEKLTASNNEWFWCPFSSTDDLGEEPSSDSSGTGDGGLAGM